jgi:hypothetical protein
MAFNCVRIYLRTFIFISFVVIKICNSLEALLAVFNGIPEGRPKHVVEVIINALWYLLIVLFDHSTDSAKGNDGWLL